MTENNILLFFHPGSNACNKLREVVSKSPKNKNIKYINISDLNNIPSGITSIPALLINNKEILLGKDVFNYFYEEEEIGFLGFNNKGSNNIANLYSTIDDDSIVSGTNFSTLDAPAINDGIPTYEESESKIDKLEDITSRRASLEKEIGIDHNKKSSIV